MSWNVRSKSKAKIPRGRPTPVYGNMRENFTIQMHYHGRFMHNLGRPIYFGGEFDYIDYCNSDEISMVEIKSMAKDVGITDVESMTFRYSRIVVNGTECLSELQTDLEAMNLINFVDDNKMVSVFVEHADHVENEIDESVSLNQGMRFVYGNEGDGDDAVTESEDDNSRNANIETMEAGFNEQQFGLSFDIQDNNGSDSDDENASVGSDSADSNVMVDSDYDVSDDDVLFEEFIDPEVEWGANVGKNNSAAAESTSAQRVSSKVVNLHRGFPVVDKKTENLNPKFEISKQYPDGPSFRKAVRQHAINLCRDLRWPLNDKTKIQAKCKHKTCPWVIYASRVKGEDTFQVKTFVNKHKCPRKQRVKVANAVWIAERYKDKIWSDPRWPINSMQFVLQKEVKLHFQPHQLYRAKRLVDSMGNGSEKEEYAMLWSYAAEIRKADPDNTVKIKCKLVNGLPKFKRMYICWSALRKGFLEGCRPVIFLDGCHLKAQSGGILLTAVGMDGNNSIYPFAYAVVEKEKFKSWCWFMSLLMQDLNIQNSGRWTIVSDKQKGLIEVVEALLPEAEHRFCVMHLYKNFKLKHKGLILKDLLWKAARSTRVVDFEKHMDEMKGRDIAAYEWLASKPPHHWHKSHFRTNSKTDVLLNNMSECFNALILKARNRPIIGMLEIIRHILMKRMHVRRDKMKSYTGGELCPKINKLMEELKKKAMEYVAHWNGENQFEIENCYGTRFKLHLGTKTCSCRWWDLTGIPCPHAISGLWHLGLEPEDHFDACYSRTTFMNAYKYMMSTLDDSSMWPKTPHAPLQPPVPTRLPGRPKKHNRKKDEDEAKQSKFRKKADAPTKMSRKGVVMTCRVCGKENHNARGCPEKPATESERSGLDIPSAKQLKVTKKKVSKGGVEKTGRSKSKFKAGEIGQSSVTSPSRVTRSAVARGAVNEADLSVPPIQSDPTVRVTRKTLGVKRKLLVHRKLPTEKDQLSFTSQKTVAPGTQQSSVTTKSKPTGSSITQDVRFSTGSTSNKKKFLQEGEEAVECRQQ